MSSPEQNPKQEQNIGESRMVSSETFVAPNNQTPYDKVIRTQAFLRLARSILEVESPPNIVILGPLGVEEITPAVLKASAKTDKDYPSRLGRSLGRAIMFHFKRPEDSTPDDIPVTGDLEPTSFIKYIKGLETFLDEDEPLGQELKNKTTDIPSARLVIHGNDLLGFIFNAQGLTTSQLQNIVAAQINKDNPCITFSTLGGDDVAVEGNHFEIIRTANSKEQAELIDAVVKRMREAKTIAVKISSLCKENS